MNRIFSYFMVAFFLAFALAVPSATAGSVNQSFVENGVTFDNIQVFVFSPGQFNNNALSAFSDSSWTDTNHNKHWSEASGNDLSSLGFNLNFDYAGLPVVLHLYSFLDGSQNADSAEFVYNGSFNLNPDISPLAKGQYALDVAASGVPEPTSMALFGAGLLFIGLVRRKIARK